MKLSELIGFVSSHLDSNEDKHSAEVKAVDSTGRVFEIESFEIIRPSNEIDSEGRLTYEAWFKLRDSE